MLLVGEALKRELSNGELAVSQFDQTVEHGRHIAKACCQVLLHAMKDFFEMIDNRNHTEHPLDNHTFIALSMLTKLPIDRLCSALAKTQVAENFGLLRPGGSNLLEVLVMGVGRCPLPVNDLPLRGNQPAQFDAHNPAMIAQAFLALLSGTAPLPNRVQQFHAVAIDHAFGLGSHQKVIRQGFILRHQAQQSRTFGQLRKQVQPISFQPAIKCSIVNTFQTKQDANRDNFTRIQVGVFALVDMRQFVVYHTKESNDYLFGSHQVVLLFAMFLFLAQESHNLLSFANSTFQLATLVTYDAEGNVTSVVDNTGTTTFKYDADNRTFKKTLPDGSVISTGYDHVGNLTTYTDGGGTVTYGYSPVNLVDSITEPDTAVTGFQYNKANQRTEIDYPNGMAVEHLEYDKAGHLNELEVTNSQKQTLISMAYSYLNPTTNTYSNLLQTMSFQDPVNPQNGTLTWLYNYDTMSRLTDASLHNSSNDAIDDFQYTYDTAGNRTEFKRPSQNIDTTYNYNNAEELTAQVNGSQTTKYTYDLDGNLTGTNSGPSYSYNARNQTTAIGSNSYTYSGTDSTERVQVNSDQFVYSGLGLMSETDANGNPVVSYTRCSCGMLLNEIIPSEGKYYYILDAQDSVVGMMDTKGNLVNAYVYDPFGNAYEQTTGVANPWQYAGGYLDSLSAAGGISLYKMGTRYYDPTLGRWTQQDPAGPQLTNPDSLNPYLYAQDNPANGTDPGGKTTWWDMFTQCISMPVTGIIGLVGGVIAAISTFFVGVFAVLQVTAPLWVAWAGIIGAILFLGVTDFCVGYATMWLILQ
jgi:RHS repeat-associated protein